MHFVTRFLLNHGDFKPQHQFINFQNLILIILLHIGETIWYHWNELWNCLHHKKASFTSRLISSQKILYWLKYDHQQPRLNGSQAIKYGATSPSFSHAINHILILIQHQVQVVWVTLGPGLVTTDSDDQTIILTKLWHRLKPHGGPHRRLLSSSFTIIWFRRSYIYHWSCCEFHKGHNLVLCEQTL